MIRDEGLLQILRIRYYEEILTDAERILRKEEISAEEEKTLRKKIRELHAYYGSDEWRRDFEDDEKGLIPGDLPRGVLSEDGIYNVLSEYRERGFIQDTNL